MGTRPPASEREYSQRCVALTGNIERSKTFVRRLDLSVHLSYTRKGDLYLFRAMTSQTNMKGAILTLLNATLGPEPTILETYTFPWSAFE